MRYYLLLSFIGSLFSSVYTQDTLLLVRDVVDFQVDPIGQLFYLDSKGKLSRHDVAADSIYTFDDNLLGPISKMDVSNPFGPILYFEDYDRILLLDRTLNEVSSLDYRSSNVIQMGDVFARNFDDQVWIFDEGDFRLKLLDGSGAVSKQSDDLQRRMKLSETPRNLFANGSSLYLYYPSRGIAVFSNYGRFIRWALEDIEDIEDIKDVELQFNGRAIFWTTEGLLYSWPLKGPVLTSPLPKTAPVGTTHSWPFRSGWLYKTNKFLLFLK